MLRDLSLLFGADEAPCDRTGSLGYVAEVLPGLGPSLVLLARHNGDVLAVDPIGAELHQAEAAPLATRLAQCLRTRSTCVFPHQSGQGPRTAFGVRLGPATMGALLGGLVLDAPDAEKRLESFFPPLAAAGNLAWLVQNERAAVERADARKNQLRIEHETLRNAHVLALATAMEEQQRRIETEQGYSQRLEKEVEDRSEALREAMEDAQRQSQELKEYSVALENANRALEQFYQAAEAANRAKSQFLANVSHEIRTPMTAILGYTDLLSDDDLPSGQLADYLDIIQRNGRHLLEIINDILDIAKIEAGRLEINKVACSPRRLLEDVCSLLSVRAEAKGIGLAAEPAGDLPPAVLTDTTCLRQILINLIGNAIKFTDRGGVRVAMQVRRAEPGRGDLEIDVIDTGIGIPSEEMERIFDPFTQAEGSARRCVGGTGLGLTICRRLTKALGGEIECRSEPGRGSTFRVTLPTTWPAGDEATGTLGTAAPAARRGEDSAADAEPLPRLAGHVLLVEDCPESQRLVATILRKAGAQVTVVGNGQEAIDALCGGGGPAGGQDAGAAAPFGAVLMDMQMPVLDGYTATGVLRSRGLTLPIIALTAHAMVGEQQRCLDCGCTDYLTKPIERRVLLTVLSRYLGT